MDLEKLIAGIVDSAYNVHKTLSLGLNDFYPPRPRRTQRLIIRKGGATLRPYEMIEYTS
jgi:hypothetical protein